MGLVETIDIHDRDNIKVCGEFWPVQFSNVLLTIPYFMLLCTSFLHFPEDGKLTASPLI